MSHKKGFFDYFSEIVGWFQIAISPTLLGTALSLVCIYYLEENTSIIFAIICQFIGIVIGIYWATKVYNNKTGTIKFMSEVQGSPEIKPQQK